MRASVVTAGGGSLSALMDVLGELDVTDIWVLQNSIGDRYLFDPPPDLTIGVLNPQSEENVEEATEGLGNLDVMFRIGRAVERGVPSIVIVPPPLPTPSPAENVAFAPCPINHYSALRTHLWAFTTAIKSRKASPPRKSEGKRPRLDTVKILSELEESGGISGFRFEELVNSVLQQAGAASVENERYGPDRAVDIVITPSDDSSSVILVEAKAGRLDERRLWETEQKLQSHVIERQASLGLVIYNDALGRQFPQRRPTPLIVRLSIKELVDQLATHNLTQVIADAAAAAIDRM